MDDLVVRHIDKRDESVTVVVGNGVGVVRWVVEPIGTEPERTDLSCVETVNIDVGVAFDAHNLCILAQLPPRHCRIGLHLQEVVDVAALSAHILFVVVAMRLVVALLVLHHQH